ncbi:hypothetical protein SeseC_00229 [Streptococcus equi subsp. zooepidemicus ATCC 35246]|nr:hypothetical protein SeseC_00229 [Streptococcus equi subsp. zooepidemicus ATCC 35246]AIA68922.1 hypothetical protein Q426_08285 [Streptococcus equi subsp. zooepidemicus CY]
MARPKLRRFGQPLFALFFDIKKAALIRPLHIGNKAIL